MPTIGRFSVSNCGEDADVATVTQHQGAAPVRGGFITVEGLDGAGKSTHIATITERLRAAGKTVVNTREPGGTPIGEKLRALVLSESMHLETETLLMFAARREHVAQVIAPALARGDWVVCDRFTDATFAYQGGGRGVAKDKIVMLENWVHGHLQPDLTLLFDIPFAVAQGRIGSRELDRFEREQADFHERVRASYLERAREFPGRIKVVDAARDISEIKVEVEKIVSTVCL
jgi:dTMP kinase